MMMPTGIQQHLQKEISVGLLNKFVFETGLFRPIFRGRPCVGLVLFLVACKIVLEFCFNRIWLCTYQRSIGLVHLSFAEGLIETLQRL